jgi:hypothetical protein
MTCEPNEFFCLLFLRFYILEHEKTSKLQNRDNNNNNNNNNKTIRDFQFPFVSSFDFVKPNKTKEMIFNFNCKSELTKLEKESEREGKMFDLPSQQIIKKKLKKKQRNNKTKTKKNRKEHQKINNHLCK